MNKLIKKILTDKSARNTAALTVFMSTVATMGNPWLS